MSEDAIQPRFAAWLESLGMPVTQTTATAALLVHGSWSFMAFIGRCRTDARRAGITTSAGSITDHEKFTTLCRNRALIECLERFPA